MPVFSRLVYGEPGSGKRAREKDKNSITVNTASKTVNYSSFSMFQLNRHAVSREGPVV